MIRRAIHIVGIRSKTNKSGVGYSNPTKKNKHKEEIEYESKFRFYTVYRCN